jgi:hypothetical protein
MIEFSNPEDVGPNKTWPPYPADSPRKLHYNLQVSENQVLMKISAPDKSEASEQLWLDYYLTKDFVGSTGHPAR